MKFRITIHIFALIEFVRESSNEWNNFIKCRPAFTVVSLIISPGNMTQNIEVKQIIVIAHPCVERLHYKMQAFCITNSQ